ncbi:MAG: hypothetical protein mread185_000351 [Mycoplasmataceae bacterium]|nr:MAG: hypothetical protein mread185_000351 [Mycoplasmataceae bacterium]
MLKTKKNVQDWLKEKYKDKNKTKEIKFDNDKELEGELEIDDYPELRKINLSGSKEITKLTIIDCPNVEEIDIYDNKIKELKGIDALVNLKMLKIQNNQIKEVDISKNTDLGLFNCHNNPDLKIVGIENLTKLYHFNGGWNNKKINGDDVKVVIIPLEENRKRLVRIAGNLGVEDKKLENQSLEKIDNFIDEEITRLQRKVLWLEENIKKELGQDALDEFITQIEIPTTTKG